MRAAAAAQADAQAGWPAVDQHRRSHGQRAVFAQTDDIDERGFARAAGAGAAVEAGLPAAVSLAMDGVSGCRAVVFPL